MESGTQLEVWGPIATDATCRQHEALVAASLKIEINQKSKERNQPWDEFIPFLSMLHSLTVDLSFGWYFQPVDCRWFCGVGSGFPGSCWDWTSSLSMRLQISRWRTPGDSALRIWLWWHSRWPELVRNWYVADWDATCCEDVGEAGLGDSRGSLAKNVPRRSSPRELRSRCQCWQRASCGKKDSCYWASWTHRRLTKVGCRDSRLPGIKQKTHRCALDSNEPVQIKAFTWRGHGSRIRSDTCNVAVQNELHGEMSADSHSCQQEWIQSAKIGTEIDSEWEREV